MRKLGATTLSQIEQLITTKADTKTQLEAALSSPTKQEELKTRKKTPLQDTHNNTLLKSQSLKQYTNIHKYQPLQKQNKMMQRHLKTIYNEIEYQNALHVQNQHSVFLNSKNRRLPIHERAQMIIEEREALLQQKRKEMQRLKQQKEQQQIQKCLAEAPPKKMVNINQAYELTDRLYKEHYSKLSRLNQEKMQHLKKQAQTFRQKPGINLTSKVLYKAKKDKENLQNDVLVRFEKYSKQKTQKGVEMQKTYKQKYLPFKPVISQQSQQLNSVRTDKGNIHTRKHCHSCVWLKNDKSHLTLTYSPRKSPLKKTFKRQTSLKISQFN